MQETTKKLRLKIGIFGKRNVGKSSIFNRLLRHDAAIVSPEPGTTTDPVKKAMEHHFLGPLLVIDTAGIDDRGTLGEKRAEKTREVVASLDIAIIAVESGGWDSFEDEILHELKKGNIPAITVINKIDEKPAHNSEIDHLKSINTPVILFSAKTGEGIQNLMDEIAKGAPTYWLESRPIVRDLYSPKELMVLVTPSYSQLPPARIPIAHNRIIRDALDNNAGCAVTNEIRLQKLLDSQVKLPSLVVTDISVFDKVADLIPDEIPLTSTAIISNRFRGELLRFIKGAAHIREMDNEDKILFADLTVKNADNTNPRYDDFRRNVETFMEKKMEIEFCGRKELPEDFSRYKLMVLRGEEEITGKKTLEKLDRATVSGIPMTNLDILMAMTDKRYLRILSPFLGKYDEIDEIITGN